MGTFDFYINGEEQIFSENNIDYLYFYTSTTFQEWDQLSGAMIISGTSNTWTTLFPVQSPEVDIYAFYNQRNGNHSLTYINMEAGTISSVGSTEITDQALVIDKGRITISGSMPLKVNGVQTDVEKMIGNFTYTKTMMKLG